MQQFADFVRVVERCAFRIRRLESVLKSHFQDNPNLTHEGCRRHPLGEQAGDSAAKEIHQPLCEKPVSPAGSWVRAGEMTELSCGSGLAQAFLVLRKQGRCECTNL